MSYPLLHEILVQEGSDFTTASRWRPQHLLFVPQSRALLRDMERRYRRFEAARPEFETLERGDRYIKSIVRMRFWLRQAFYNWKANQLVFVQAVAGFSAECGFVLRFLKFDQIRGRLNRGDEKEGV